MKQPLVTFAVADKPHSMVYPSLLPPDWVLVGKRKQETLLNREPLC